MATHSLVFDAVAEATPGPKWTARWKRSWPAYEAWFLGRGGDEGPARADCETALARHMPELVPVFRALTRLAGNGDRAARFLSTWCPPHYLGGCSVAAVARDGAVRLVRNYDLAPDLNEGLLLRSEWTGRPVIGMVEFLWGLSDGINGAGLAVALAYGGRQEVALGFGVTTILRYVLETCTTVAQGLAVLRCVPSHMAYNVTLADRHGTTATAELLPGGGARILRPAIATNHQHGPEPADRPGFTHTHARQDHLKALLAADIAPHTLGNAFLRSPLRQDRYAAGFGTLFTADYDPAARAMTLRWPDQDWPQSIAAFTEGRREIAYHDGDTQPAERPDIAAAVPEAAHATGERRAGALSGTLPGAMAAIRPHLTPAGARAFDRWSADAASGTPDWTQFARVFGY